MSGDLVSFSMLAFNQQAFVADALRGALAQTYQPLEIIVSDDCSTDGTFEIIREELRKYRGPHEVVAMQTPRNLGIGEHVNHVVAKCRGRLVVGGAGDDVSLPHRVETIVQAWDKTGRRAKSIFSAYQVCDERGELTPQVVASKQSQSQKRLQDRVRIWNAALGCVQAFDKESFDIFGPLNPDTVFEDAAINFRSWAIGGILEIPEILVHYRVHTGAVTTLSHNANSIEAKAKAIRWQRARVALFKQYLKDLDMLESRGLAEKTCIAEARTSLLSLLREADFQYRFTAAETRLARLLLLKEYVIPSGMVRRSSKSIIRSLFPAVDSFNLRRLAK